MIYLAMAYSSERGFDLIGTSACEEAAWDNVADWCKDHVEGFPQDLSDGHMSREGAVKEWLSDNDAAEEVTVEAIPDAIFTPEWSGSPCPRDPDNFWIDDATGERVNAATGERNDEAQAAYDAEWGTDNGFSPWDNQPSATDY